MNLTFINLDRENDVKVRSLRMYFLDNTGSLFVVVQVLVTFALKLIN